MIGEGIVKDEIVCAAPEFGVHKYPHPDSLHEGDAGCFHALSKDQSPA